MGCISPLEISVFSRSGKKYNYDVPCGGCLNCRMTKESQLTFLSNKELLDVYQSGRGASFVTLTYNDDCIPVNEEGLVTLRRKDLQNFIKNMRRNMEYHKQNIPFKYIYCGELGSDTNRPHYHIVFLGLSDCVVKQYTKKLWKFGLCDVGPLSNGGIRYVCKYLTKSYSNKEIKKLRDELGVERPFVYHSIGLGKDWINRYMDQIAENDYTFNLNSKKYLFPKYVLKYVSSHTGIDYRPAVKKFLSKEIKMAHIKGISYKQFQAENDYIRYKNNVAALRSKGSPVDDITTSRKWVRPYHSFDRNIISDLASEAYNIGYCDKSKEVPLRGKIKRSVVSYYDGSINWSKYLNLCSDLNKIPF